MRAHMDLSATPLAPSSTATERLRAILVATARAGLYLHVAALPLSMAGMQAGFAITALSLILLRIAGVPVWRRSHLDLPVLAFAGAAIASQILAFAWLGSDAFLWRTLLSPLLIIATLGLAQGGVRAEAIRLVFVWAGAAMVPALVAWPQYFTGLDLLHALGLRKVAVVSTLPAMEGRFLATGLFTWHTRLAHALTSPLFLLAGLALVGFPSGKRRTIAALASIAVALAVVLTFTRSAWFGLLVGTAVLALLSVGWRRRLVGFAALAVAGALLFALHPGARARLASTFQGEKNRDRHAIWSVCKAMAAERPLVGVGFGNLPIAGRSHFDESPLTGPMGERAKRRCHNVFLTSWVEGGPLLLGAAAFLFLGPAWGFWSLRRRTDRVGRAACAGGLAAIAAMLVNSLVHDPLYASEAAFGFGFLLAVATILATTPSPGSAGVAPAAGRDP